MENIVRICVPNIPYIQWFRQFDVWNWEDSIEYSFIYFIIHVLLHAIGVYSVVLCKFGGCRSLDLVSVISWYLICRSIVKLQMTMKE